MPADEATRGSDVDRSRARTGARHAAPKKPLFTRFHMPAGKAIASVAMPTAVIVGMGFTSTLALADNNGTPSPSTSAKSLTADEYKDCVKALDDSKSPSASPSPSASQSGSAAADKPSADTTGDGKGGKDAAGGKDAGGSGNSSSPDSGSDDKAEPTPTATAGSPAPGTGSGSGGDAGTPAPSASQGSGNLLDTIGDTLGGILTGGKKDSGTASASPTPSASTSSPSSGAPSAPATGSDTSSSGSKAADTAKNTVGDTVAKAGKTVGDTVKKATEKVSRTAADTVEAGKDATGSATPTPSASASAAAQDCPLATEDESGVDNKTLVADDPWYLNASSLLLKGADYQGVVEVKTANGTKKKVLKYVISGGTDIGDLHQTVQDKQANKTYHVQASKGSTSTIRGGDTVMYTQSISGNLFGLIPVTFSPDSPPPLNIPLIYFTNVKVVQAAQFGGNLHIPGMHVYTTD
ncbi:hypothetical protein [Streptomyces sp. NPDC096012]|uniref:hypothetical protein n=1 Tax=Streptomyces sp. NPDC096012 TaxID=3155684 RepID=UPI00336AD5CB